MGTSTHEPELRRKAIPVHEPQAASSVAPPVLATSVSARTAQAALSATQGTLALTLPWENQPATLLTAPYVPAPATLREVRDQPLHEVVAGRGRWPGTALPGARPVAVLPDAEDWATKFVQAAMEVALGLRPASQLIRWTSLEVHEALVRRGALVARAGRRSGVSAFKPQLRALLICTPANGVCEVAAVIAEAERVRAVAFRMEAVQNRWRVTVLEIG